MFNKNSLSLIVLLIDKYCFPNDYSFNYLAAFPATFRGSHVFEIGGA